MRSFRLLGILFHPWATNTNPNCCGEARPHHQMHLLMVINCASRGLALFGWCLCHRALEVTVLSLDNGATKHPPCLVLGNPQAPHQTCTQHKLPPVSILACTRRHSCQALLGATLPRARQGPKMPHTVPGCARGRLCHICRSSPTGSSCRPAARLCCQEWRLQIPHQPPG